MITFTISGADSNATRTSKERDISSMSNKIEGLGYGDGINQIKTSCYSASTIYSTLSSDITSTSSSIALTDATSFPASGTIRVMEEQITYTGKSTNTLTGCTRGANSTTALAHKKGCYVETHYTTASPGTDSSIDLYGVLEKTIVDRSIIDLETLEVIASKQLLERALPIERIRITPNDPIDIAQQCDIGDLVYVKDDEAAIDGQYRIVSMQFADDYGELSLLIEVSNVSLEFIAKMQEEREKQQNLQKYMQGATNIYAVNSAENCDYQNPLNMRFYIPEEAIAINKVLLNFKMKPYRAYSSTTSDNSDSLQVSNTSATTTNATLVSDNTWQTMISITVPDNDCDGVFFNFGYQYVYMTSSHDGYASINWRLEDTSNYYPGSSGAIASGGHFIDTGTIETPQGGSIAYYLPGNHKGKTFTLKFYIDGFAGSYQTHRYNLTANVSQVSKHAHDVSFAITEEELANNSVNIKCGLDGDTLTNIGTYTEDQTKIDLTDAIINNVGAGHWANIQFNPLGGAYQIDKQEVIDYFIAVNSENDLRAGTRKTITNKILRKVAFKLSKSGSPTGTLYCRVRKVSDDSVIQETSMDVATLTGTSTWTEFTFTNPSVINEEVRICAEYSGGTGSNYVKVDSSDNGFGIENEYSSTYMDDDWTDESTIKCAYRHYFDSGRMRIEADAVIQVFIESI